jgi:hypothetical protein
MLSRTESVLREVGMERREQVSKHGYDDIHDDDIFHANGELAEAACYMAYPHENVKDIVDVKLLWPDGWDPPEEFSHPSRAKAYRDRLIVAAAFLVAEIERLDRVQQI